jgi:uncharacterized damage-inducible protein DinB
VSSPERALLARLFQRNRWYFDHLLEVAATVDTTQVSAEARGSYGSIRETMLHVLDAMTLWGKRFEGESPARIDFVDRNANDDALRAACERLTAEYVARLRDQGFDLTRVIDYRSTEGDTRSNRAGDAVLQVANHSSHHLAQVSTLLTQAGAAPLEGDYIFWVRSNPDA